MKKLLCIIVSLLLVVSSGTFAYARRGDRGDNGQNSGSSSSQTATAASNKDQVDKQLNNLMKQLKNSWKKQAAKRQDIIKQIMNLKKQSDQNSKGVFINGDEVSTDVAPVIKYNRLLLPIRAITNALGAEVKWDASTHIATITKGDTVIVLDFDKKTATVNGQPVTLDVPPEMINNRIVVPVRFIAEAFNQKVEWDESSGSVIVEDNSSATPTPAPTVTPGATVTPTPTPIPTVTVEPTATPTPTPMPTVTPEPTATATPVPTATPEPTATPTPVPTVTPEPTATPVPTSTPN